MSFLPQNCRVDSLFPSYGIPVDALRLDLIHPIISGNKWFKLKEYLRIAAESNKSSLLTFGGAFSNHIVATAAAAKMNGLTSIGIIRGEEPRKYSHTLTTAKDYGMHLFFISREAYKLKYIPETVYKSFNPSQILQIPEGGYGALGAEGAGSILQILDTSSYTHIVSGVGTGTTLAGLVAAATSHQKIIGIPVLKNAISLQAEIESLLPEKKKAAFQLVVDYHFGGYARHTETLIRLMNELFSKTGIPTDFVYTGKVFYAVIELFQKGYFSSSYKILLLHTGGLQGNLSLTKGTLIFG